MDEIDAPERRLPAILAGDAAAGLLERSESTSTLFRETSPLCESGQDIDGLFASGQ
jgi:hypothetical protein